MVFITAYEDFAIDTYNLAVVDYLVKPVSFNLFLQACNRAKELFDLKSNKTALTDTVVADYIFLKADYSEVKVVFSNIVYIEGLRHYIIRFHKDGTKSKIFRTTSKHLEPALSRKGFIRIHKS